MTRPYRIAMLSLHSSPLGRLGQRDTGGMSVFLQETAAGLAARDHVVDLFTLEAGLGRTRTAPLSPGVRLISLPYPGAGEVDKKRLPAWLEEISRQCRRFCEQEGRRYDLIHSHYWLSAWVGELLAGRFSLPHLVTFHTLGAIKNQACPDEREPHLRLEQERRLARHCDRVIVFTEAERRALARLYALPERAVGVVPCGVNLQRFSPRPREQARKELGCGEELVLLAVGRYVPIKGLDRVLAAVALLARKFELRLLLVGGGGGEAEFGRLAAEIGELGLKGRVSQAGSVSQEDLVLYYSAADALLVGSYQESFCLTALEAMACGTPVVGTAVGCLPDIVPAAGGKVIDRGADARELAAAVEEVLISGVWARLSTEEIRQVAASYSWRHTVMGLERQYRAVLAERRSWARMPCE